MAKSDDLYWFRTTRRPNLVVVEIPGFCSQALGAVAFLTAGVVAGVVWGRRAAALLAVQLVSPTYAAALCSQLVRRPYIAFTSTSGQLSEAAYLINARFSRVRTKLLRQAAFVAAQTPAAAEELKRIVDPERVAVIPNPVKAVVAAPLTGNPRAIYTGRLSEEKDLLRLLDAWRVVAEPRADAVLTLAGDGGRYRSVESDLRERVGQDPVLGRSVVFTGWVSDVGPLLAGSDVYVFPSLTEGMSNALLEACAWGRVVVASDIPSNRAVLGDDYPLLFPAGDTEGLVAALNRALGDDHVRADAVDRVLRRANTFSLEVVVDRVEGLIERSVDESAPRPSPLSTPRTRLHLRDPRSVQSRFERQASGWDSIYTGAGSFGSRRWNRLTRGNVIARLHRTFELAGDLHGKTVLDIGCGSGRYLARAISGGAAKAVGIDVAAEMLALAQRLANEQRVEDQVELRLEDYATSRLSGTFDLVLISGVFDYEADPLGLLVRARGWCNGLVIATFPRRSGLRSPVRQLYWRARGLRTYYFRRVTLARLARAAGLRPLLVEKLGPLYLLAAEPAGATAGSPSQATGPDRAQGIDLR